MSDLEAVRGDAEVVLERLLVQWHQDPPAGPGSVSWDDTAREAVDALTAVVQAVDRVHHGPRLVRQRTHS